MSPIRIIIAEDQYFTRQGICGVLEQNPLFQVVGQAESGEDALAQVKAKEPDLLLLDISMPPGIDGVEVIKRLRGEGNSVSIIALTDDKRAIRKVEKAGANGYLPKENFQMLEPTLLCVVSTGSPIFINPKVSQDFARIKRRVEQGDLLNSELDVWKLLAYRNEEIARRLVKSVGSIRNATTNIYFKLDIPKSEKVSQRIQAIELARGYHILEEPEVESSWDEDLDG